jgi:hypothetical protein
VVISFFSLIKDAFNKQEPPGIKCDENEDKQLLHPDKCNDSRTFFCHVFGKLQIIDFSNRSPKYSETIM